MMLIDIANYKIETLKFESGSKIKLIVLRINYRVNIDCIK